MTNAQSFVLRTKPQPVTRLSKRAIIVITGVVMLIVVLALMVTISPPSARETPSIRELYNVEIKPVSDRLNKLPATYQDHAPQVAWQSVPELQPVMPPTPSQVTEMSPKSSPMLTERRYVSSPSTASDAHTSALFFARSNRQGPMDAEQMIADALADVSTKGKIAGLAVRAGTLIPASLLTGINSDLPGPAIAQITQHIYDTDTGQHLLIPQGARLIGIYDSSVDFGQKRVFISWTRIINPDGSSIDLDNLGAADLSGYAGLTDRVDNHTGELVGAGILSTLLGVGAELSIDDNDDDVARALREGLQGTANNAGQRLVRRQLNIKPTLTVRPGWAFQVIVTEDLSLAPYGGS
ncbi:TrbI/VirB10 family protein [Parvularcula sp. IMCC14364]|uniref:TrbI/VirB10 family protein n=1 Tax=Parvularcula sp. IMCC14364 TaxID=3067902 RepID=UPI002740334D|nr:TrbI/VirB10 family protein [Parvularcula sp. IMCC14364]